jgi:hypothetical protein
MQSDEHPTQWIAVIKADTAAEIEHLRCYDRNNPVNLPKATNPGKVVKQISIPNCATLDIPENGTIYEVTS